MPKTITTRPGKEQKWDWTLFHYLYVHNVDVADILKLPEFEGLSAAYAHNKVSREGWPEERDRMNKRVAFMVDKTITDDIKRTREAFKEFMLEEVEQEMKLYRARLKGLSLEAQGERLKVLLDLRKVAAPVLGLEEGLNGDDNSRGYKSIYQIHVQGNAVIAPGDGRQPSVADMIPPDIANDDRLKEVLARINTMEPVREAESELVPAPVALLEDLEASKRKAANEKKLPRAAHNGKRKLGMPVAALS